MTQYLFVTGGVVSSLGKGLTAASLGALLESRGLKVTLVKLDPYINVDPGTMSPYQHGEVFVTDDGAETDLDLGHYERFITQRMTKANNFTSGQVYADVIRRERQGKYLGQTIQVIPHITDEIRNKIRKAVSDDIDIALVEIGGTVGDIESLPFLEAIRQFRLEMGAANTLFLHLTLVPYIPTSGEVKTKPTQHSVKELRSIGIQPDILMCRSEQPLPKEERAKIALFTNVQENAVISISDVSNIYQIPLLLQEQQVDTFILDKLGRKTPEAGMSAWKKIVNAVTKHDIRLAMVGKYMELKEAYKSLNEAIAHAGIHTETRVHIEFIDAEGLEKNLHKILDNVDAVLIPGGFGDRGVEGKIKAIQFAREQGIPFLGICLGMQLALVEFARNVAGMTKAHSSEFDPETPDPIISLIGEWQDDSGNVEKRHKGSNMGGTMRLGGQTCLLSEGSLVKEIYGQEVIRERHRHRYEVNPAYVNALSDAGMRFSGRSEDKALVEIIELPSHPWFIACQFHPEFTSNPREGHVLFNAFVRAAIAYQQSKDKS